MRKDWEWNLWRQIDAEDRAEFEDEDEARECAGDLEELLDYALREGT